MTARYALEDPKALNILLTRELYPDLIAPLRDAYTIYEIFDKEPRAEFIAKEGGKIEAVITSGALGLGEAEMAQMPKLKIIQTFAVGYESVDVAAAKRRGIAVCNTAGINDWCVAEHAMGLMMTVTRRFHEMDAKARTESWESDSFDWQTVTGKKLGIIGLGHIGGQLAKRAAAFDMEIGYCNRRKKPDSAFRYFSSVPEMAEWADYLVATCPGGKETYHIVNTEVLGLLGPKGYVVNVSRGTVLDADALVDALESGAIAGAALDVVHPDGKPSARLLAAPNLLLTPHIGGRSPETQTRRIHLIRSNLENAIAGRPLLTPVPEMAA